MRGAALIANKLSELGLDAYTEDGWVYVKLPDGRLLEITAEYGSSLDATILGTAND